MEQAIADALHDRWTTTTQTTITLPQPWELDNRDLAA